MWEELINCYQAVGRRGQAEVVVRQRMKEDGETPILCCLLGDTIQVGTVNMNEMPHPLTHPCRTHNGMREHGSCQAIAVHVHSAPWGSFISGKERYVVCMCLCAYVCVCYCVVTLTTSTSIVWSACRNLSGSIHYRFARPFLVYWYMCVYVFMCSYSISLNCGSV